MTGSCPCWAWRPLARGSAFPEAGCCLFRVCGPQILGKWAEAGSLCGKVAGRGSGCHELGGAASWESVVWWSVRLMETRAWCPPVPGQWSGRGAPQKSNDTFVPERVALTAVPPALSLTTYLLPGRLGGWSCCPRQWRASESARPRDLQRLHSCPPFFLDSLWVFTAR